MPGAMGAVFLAVFSHSVFIVGYSSASEVHHGRLRIDLAFVTLGVWRLAVAASSGKQTKSN